MANVLDILNRLDKKIVSGNVELFAMRTLASRVYASVYSRVGQTLSAERRDRLAWSIIATRCDVPEIESVTCAANSSVLVVEYYPILRAMPRARLVAAIRQMARLTCFNYQDGRSGD